MKLFLALALAGLSAAAQAEIITYTFAGEFETPTITASGSETLAAPFAGLLKQGDHYSGSVTFDTYDEIAYMPNRMASSTWYKTLDFQFKVSSDFDKTVPSWTGPVDVPYNSDVTGPIVVTSSWTISNGNPLGPWVHGERFSMYATANSDDGLHAWTISLGGDSEFPADNMMNKYLTLYAYDNAEHSVSTVSAIKQNVYVYTPTYPPISTSPGNVSPVPEPSSALMMLAAIGSMGGIAALRRRS